MKKGVTLIELILVVALLGLISTTVVIAANPAKRFAQTRDAIRKNDIGQIVNAIISYEVFSGQYPDENGCDSSIGMKTHGNCPANPPESDWNTNSPLYTALIDQQILKILPKDPLNNGTYHYRYEPRNAQENPCKETGTVCRYWVGVRLEDPIDSANPIYRCSDIETLNDGPGCKEVNNFYK